MALPFISGAYRALLGFTSPSAGSKPFSTHIDYVKNVNGDAITATQVATALTLATAAFSADATGAATISSYFVSALDLDTITVYDLGTNDAPVIVSNAGPTWGSGAADPLPPDVAMVVSHRSSRRGRAGRGRSYLAGLTEAVNTAGLITDACRNDINDAWVAHLRDLAIGGTSGVTQAVLSQAGVAPLAYTVVSTVVNEHWDTQRRRGIA